MLWVNLEGNSLVRSSRRESAPWVLSLSATNCLGLRPFPFVVASIRETEARMGKKARRASVDASPPMDCGRVGKDTINRGRFKHQYLMQDYQELKKETEEKKKQLQLIKQKKRRLMNEVKILGKKYLSFLENPSQTALFRIKKQFNQLSSSSACNNLPLYALREVKSQKVTEAAKPSTTTLLDLNQFSHLDGESHMESLKLQVLSEYAVSQGPDSQTFAICRDAQKNPRRVCRRKTTWQDPAIHKL